MRRLFLSALISLLAFPLAAFAAPRATPFRVGETLDPGAEAQPCGPTDANCFPADWTASSTDVFRLTGKVGIGTSTPNNLLSVYELIDFNNVDLTTYLGYQAGKYVSAGAVQNTFIGYQAGLSSSTASTNAADFNTGIGYQALYSNTIGTANTATGRGALFSNTTGNYNTANGYMTLNANTTGIENVAMGLRALNANTTGLENTAIGFQSMFTNIAGNNNSAYGYKALYSNTSSNNTASGWAALLLNSSGSDNTGFGYRSLATNTTGASTTAIGANAGAGNTTGNYNTFIGFSADAASNNLTNATAIGANAIVGASNSLVLGGTGSYAVNVGIGTTSPEYKLDTVGTVRFQGGTNGSAMGNPSFYSPSPQSGTSVYSSGDSLIYRAYSYKIINGVKHFSATYTEIGEQFIVNNGDTLNISIDPGANADGVRTVRQHNYNGYIDYRDGTAWADDGSGWTSPLVLTPSAESYYLLAGYYDGTRKWSAYGDSNAYFGGNMGIGTTTPTRKLTVNGSVGLTGLTNSGSGNYICLTSSNEITYSATACAGVSSEKFKHDITTLSVGGLEQINALRPVSFIYNRSLSPNDQSKHLGFIAEEVAEVNPDLAAYDSEGKIRSVKYDEFAPVIVKAIQELDTKVSVAFLANGSTTPNIDTSIWNIVQNKLSSLGLFFENSFIRINNLFVKTLRIEDSVCVDDVCVTKDQFKSILLQAGGTTVVATSTTITTQVTPLQENTVIIVPSEDPLIAATSTASTTLSTPPPEMGIVVATTTEATTPVPTTTENTLATTTEQI